MSIEIAPMRPADVCPEQGKISHHSSSMPLMRQVDLVLRCARHSSYEGDQMVIDASQMTVVLVVAVN